MPQVILALPAYNEAECIGDLLEAARRAFEGVAKFQPRVLVVDDGSTDGTAEVVRRFRAPFPVEVVSHRENRGLGPAILSALRAALDRGAGPDDVIVNMDADNTHPPDVIPSMLDLLDGGADVVIASRYQRGSRQVGVPLKRRLLSAAARWLFAWRLRLPGVRDYTCGFRAYRARTIRRAFDAYGDRLITRAGFACTDEILVNLARLDPRPRIAEVPFTLRYDRKRGQSKLELLKTARETFKMLLRTHR
jgi:dolichol-phosphate mannosyltransferase